MTKCDTVMLEIFDYQVQYLIRFGGKCFIVVFGESKLMK